MYEDLPDRHLGPLPHQIGTGWTASGQGLGVQTTHHLIGHLTLLHPTVNHSKQITWEDQSFSVINVYLTIIIPRKCLGYKFLKRGQGKSAHWVSYHRLISNKCEWNNSSNRTSDKVRPKMGNCAALWRSIVQQGIPIVRQIVQQSILNFKCFGGVLNSVLIGILVYLSAGIDTLSVEIICCCFFWCQIGQRLCHIFLPEKIHPSAPPPPFLRTELLECIMSKILHTNLFTHVYKCALFFNLKFHLENQHAYYACWKVLSSYEVICIMRQKYEVEQLPTPSFVKHGE